MREPDKPFVKICTLTPFSRVTVKTSEGVCNTAVVSRFSSLLTADSALFTSSGPLFPHSGPITGSFNGLHRESNFLAT
jgi:hypothetical protein